MIFKTFDSNVDKWTTKIGTFGMSFQNLGTTISTSFQRAKDAAENSENSAGFFQTFKDSLLSSTVNGQDYKRNKVGEIVTLENIDTYIPTLDIENRENKLADIKDIRNGNKTKYDFYSSLKPGEDYLRNLIENTEDLSTLTGDDLVEANEKARASVLSQNEALKQQSIAAKTSKMAFQALATAGGMVAGFLIAKGIELAATAIDNLIHRQERLAEAAKKATENIQNSYSSFSELKQSTGSITQEFAQLSQHVNQATGENIDLPAEEYQRFLELSNQLAETFPTIGYTIDENGNKITGLSGSIDEITQSINGLVQAQQLLTHQEISDNMEDTYKKTRENVTDYKNQIENLKRRKSGIPDVPEKVQELLDGKKVKFKMSGPNDHGFLNDIRGLFQKEGMQLQFQEGQLFLKQSAEEAELNAGEIQRILSGADQIGTKYDTNNKALDQKIAELQNKAQMSMNSFSPNLTSWLTTDQNYSAIVQSYGNDLGTAIQKSVQSINLADIDSKNWGGMENWITDNILAPLNNADNAEIRQAYTRLFTDTDLPLDSAMEYLEEIEEYYSGHDLTIPVIFTNQKEKFTELQEKFKERNSSFQTGDTTGLDAFFQENSIDEADEYEKWLSVTEGITNATEAMAAWKREAAQAEESPLSFQESWNALGTTGDDNSRQVALEAKEQLLELANAGRLTAKELQNSSAGKTIMEQTKLSAEEATEAVNALADKTSQLSTMKSGIQSISSVLAQKQENLGNNETKTTGIDSNTLSGFDASIKGLDSWKQFEETLGNGKSSMDSCKQAANNLASEWINSNNFLSQLNDTNKEYYISQLQGMGLQNAEAIVTETLANKERELNAEKQWTKATTTSLANATVEEINTLASLNGWSDQTKNTLYALALQKNLVNGTTLDFSSDISGIIEFVEKLGYSAEAMKTYQQVRAGANGSAGMPSNVSEGYYGKKAQKEYNSILKKLKKVPKTKLNLPSAPKEANPDNKNNPPQKTKQSFDWLDRYITILSQRIDLLKAKLENLFSVNAKNNNLTKQIKAVNKEIKAYSKEASIYSQKANAYAANKNSKGKRNISKSLQKQIDNGKFKGKTYGQLVKEYDEKDANKIQKYMDLKDKAATAKQNKAQARKTKRDLKIQKHQNWVDYYDTLNNQYDTQIENATTAAQKNNLEDKKINATKKSYNQQIKKAELEYGKNSSQVKTLKAQKKSAVREIKIEKQQNLQNEADAYRDMLEAQKETATTAGEKNRLLQQEQAYITGSYNAQIEIAKLEGNVAKQKALEAESQKALLDNQIEQLQNTREQANGYQNMLEAQKENAATANQKNAYLAQEVQYINQSYNAQIQAANLQQDTALATKLEAERQQELRNNAIEQLQNLSAEQSAQYELNQQRQAAANSAKEKNKFEADSRKNLQSQYDYEIQIAKENGDLVEMERLRLEQEQKIEESYQRQIDNIREEYDLLIGLNDAQKSTIDAQIAALQANGYGVGTELYQIQMSLDQDSYNQSLKEIERISAELPNLSGNARKQAEIELEAEKQKAWEYQKNLGEFQQTINDINLSKLERIGTMLGYYAENLEYIQDILSHSDFTLSDKEGGGMSMEGLSNIAVTFAQISNNQEQLGNLYAQLAEKRRQLAESNVEDGDQLLDEINTLVQQTHDLEKANYDFGDSIKTMVIDSLNSLSDALDENISKYKESLQAQKDLYDYRKKVSDQLKSIASLEKQLAALQGSDTEEARARIQKLQIQLEEEHQNLKDMEYDKYIQDQEEMLDKVSDDFQDFITNVAKMNVSEICAAMKTAVSDNLPAITNSIENAFAESSKIGDLATSINGLKETIEKLDFSGNITTRTDENGDIHYGYTDENGNKVEVTVNNSDKPDTVTNYTVNGKPVPLPKKEVTNTGGKIDKATGSQHTKSNTGPKQKIAGEQYQKEKEMRNAINNLLTNADSYINNGSSRMSYDPLNQYIYPKYNKMLDPDQEDILLKDLDIDGNSSEREALYEAKEKIEKLGFSQGGIASSLNRIALSNGDDGWATLKRGEAVLTPAQTKQLQKLAENLLPRNTVASSIASLPDNPIPTQHSPAAANTTVRNVDIHLDGSHVMDADSFIQTLHNPRVLREVSSGVSSQLNSVMSNKLGNF